MKTGKQYRLFQEDYHKYGGKENILGMYEDFYRLFMTDPVLNVLFDMRDPDTAVGYAAHSERLAGWFLSRNGNDRAVHKLPGREGNVGGNSARAHNRAKACPMRGKELKGQ